MKLKMLLQQREQIFLCKTAQLVITKFIDCVKRSCYLGYNVLNTELHLKLIDLDPNRSIIILFILPLTEKFRRNKNIFFQISINEFEAYQLFPVLRFFVL